MKRQRRPEGGRIEEIMYRGLVAVMLPVVCAIALWWLAVYIVFGRLLLLHWLAVVMLAVFFPMVYVDAMFARGADRAFIVWPLAGWFAIPLAIDGYWGVRRLRNRLRARHTPRED